MPSTCLQKLFIWQVSVENEASRKPRDAFKSIMKSIASDQNSKPLSTPSRSNTGMYSMGAAAVILWPPS